MGEKGKKESEPHPLQAVPEEAEERSRDGPCDWHSKSTPQESIIAGSAPHPPERINCQAAHDEPQQGPSRYAFTDRGRYARVLVGINEVLAEYCAADESSPRPANGESDGGDRPEFNESLNDEEEVEKGTKCPT
jgi:hypothetical protein